MKRAMRKVLACVIVLTVMLSAMSGALAANYPSKAFKLPAVKVRPTEAPAEQPAEVPAEQPAEEPAEKPAEAPAEQPAEEPAEQPAETPAEEPAETPAETPAEEPADEPEASASGRAVVVLKSESGSLNVRAAASKGATCVAYLRHGDEVTVLGVEGKWTHILTPDGVEGYVASSYLRESLPEEPTEEPAEEPAEEPTEEPTEEPAEEPVEEPTEEPVEEPVEEPAELRYTFERDADGNLVLDENGNPVAIVPEGMEIPVTYLRDENGNLILDENGDPIVKDTVPAGAEIIATLEDMLDPDCYIDVYIAWKDEKKEIGNEATLVAVLYGYDKVVYSLQWQNSKDDENWTDVSGATESRLTVTATEENAYDYWRVQVTVTDVKG